MLGLGNKRVTDILSAEYIAAILAPVPLVDLAYTHHRKQVILRITERDLRVEREAVKTLGRKGDRYRENDTACQTHCVYDRVIIRLAHKAAERRESANRKEIKV